MSTTEPTFIEKISLIQNGLRAPKDKSTYAYSYRNAEDILGKVKPLLLEHSLAIYLEDEILAVGEPCRWFIKSTAAITDGEHIISGVGIAEILSPAIGKDSGKASMNESQASGATSSYARKYALGAVLGIDDGDDADDIKYQPSEKTNPAKAQAAKPSSVPTGNIISAETLKELNFLGKDLGLIQEQSKQVWDNLYHEGIYRGKWNPQSKEWTGTKITTQQVGQVVKAFADEAGMDDERKKLLFQRFLGDTPEVDVLMSDDLSQYPDEPF